MSSLSYYPLQKAIYEMLTGHIPLLAHISGVYSHVPQNTNFPYVTLNEVSASDFSNLSKTGVEHAMTINIWSREAGYKQCSDIMEIIYGLLHNGTLTILGKNLTAMRVLSTSIQLGNDGWTYHGVIELNVILMDN